MWVMKIAGWLVLVFWCVDRGLEVLGLAFHLACAGGLPTTGAMAIVLGVGGSAWAKVELTRGLEEVWAMRRR